MGGFVLGQLGPAHQGDGSWSDLVALPLARAMGLIGGHRTKCCLLMLQCFGIGILGFLLGERAVWGNGAPTVCF